jgi:hypothetical protein
MGEAAEDTSMMDDLAAAWDKHEQETEEVVAQEEQVIAPEEVREATQEATPEEAPEATPEEAQEATPEEAPEVTTEETPEEPDSPPPGLSPAAREDWDKTPQSVKDDLVKREKDFAAGIQKYAESAKRAEAMDRTLAPYAQLFAINGGPQNWIAPLRPMPSYSLSMAGRRTSCRGFCRPLLPSRWAPHSKKPRR